MTEIIATDIVDSLRDNGVRLVACTIVDNAGVTRVKGVPIGKFERVAQYGVGLSNVFATFLVDDQIASSPGFDSPTGDMRLIPDLEATVAMASAPGWAWAPVDQYDQELEVMPVCQRSLLKRVTKAAAAKGITFKMAFEVEFTLLDADGQPAHTGPGYGAWAFQQIEAFAIDLIDALEAQGLSVEQLHPEYAAGQYEISIGAASPLQAADRHVLLRMTIRRIARQHGLQASFAPIVLLGQVGNGAHLHFSAWKDGRNLMSGGSGAEAMTTEAEAMGAGLLEYLPDLIAIFAPSVPSYARLVPDHWAGGFNCWGKENREASIRLIQGTVGTREDAANLELKTIDQTSNPYLATTMVIAASLDGLERGLKLPPSLEANPSAMSEEERTAQGIHRLPENLGQAVGRLTNSELARKTMGDPLFEAFLAVRRQEWQSYGQAEQGEVVNTHRWRYG